MTPADQLEDAADPQVRAPDRLGVPRVHLRRTDSTNERAIALARNGAPHGTLVSAEAQTAGRGRQGRSWITPPGRALLASVIVRDPHRLLPLLAAVAVAQAIEQHVPDEAQIKWPNDILVAGKKVAGILVESRPQEAWAVVGLGLNVALRPADLAGDLGARAATLGLSPEAIEPLLQRILASLERWLTANETALLEAWRARDALLGREVFWAGGHGRAAGLDGAGRLIVEIGEGAGRCGPPERMALEAGEVHLQPG